MRKEYSDLPDSQKVTYYKRGVVFGIFVFLPIIILFGALFGVMTYYAPLIDEQRSDNSTATQQMDKPAKSNPLVESSMSVLILMFGVGLVGFSLLGTVLGGWVCDKLKLWTDFQLETAEKRIAEIKKEMSK
jgi:hypothetical protein